MLRKIKMVSNVWAKTIGAFVHHYFALFAGRQREDLRFPSEYCLTKLFIAFPGIMDEISNRKGD